MTNDNISMLVKPSNKSEEWVICKAEQSINKNNSWQIWVLVFLFSTVLLIMISWSKIKTDPYWLSHFAYWAISILWIIAWGANFLLWHERKTFYKIIQRMAKIAHPDNEKKIL